MAEWLEGRILANNIRQKVKSRIEKLSDNPGLGVILAGDNPASALYVKLKEESAREVGIYVEKATFGENVTEKELIAKIEEFNERNDIHGILIQLPLPEGLNTQKVINAMSPEKDVDGFHPKQKTFAPPVALAVMRLIQSTMQPLRNKKALIVSNSEVFAKPIIDLSEEVGILAEHKSPKSDLETIKNYDILIIAVGQPNFLAEDQVNPNGIIIDIGTNRIDGKVVGDVSKEVKEKVAFATPVPGGVGPLTVSYLMNNVLKSYIEMNSPKEDPSTEQ